MSSAGERKFALGVRVAAIVADLLVMVWGVYLGKFPLMVTGAGCAIYVYCTLLKSLRRERHP